MLRLRIWIAGAAVWFFLLYNVERIDGAVNIATFVYVLSALLAIATLAVPRLRGKWVACLFAGSLVVLLVLKVRWGYGVLGAALTNTVTEIVALGVTLFLSRRIADGIEWFERSAAEVTTLQRLARVPTLETSQADMFRDVRLARRFRRPLTLVALAPTPQSKAVAIDRSLEEVHRRTVADYLNARVADLLVRETGGLGTIARHKGQFLLLLPEIEREASGELVQRLATAAREEFGLVLDAGTACFPDDELTFVGLVERAMADLEQHATSSEVAPAAVHSVA